MKLRIAKKVRKKWCYGIIEYRASTLDKAYIRVAKTELFKNFDDTKDFLRSISPEYTAYLLRKSHPGEALRILMELPD